MSPSAHYLVNKSIINVQVGANHKMTNRNASQSHNKIFPQFSIVVFSGWLSLSKYTCVCACVCVLCMFVSCVEEQKVSAGLACVGGLWDSP